MLLFRAAAALGAVGFVCACASPAPQPEQAEASPVPGKVARSDGQLQVAAKGWPDQLADSQTQRRATSRDAAISEARGKLVAYAKRLKTSSGATVGQRAAKDAAFESRLQTWAAGLPVAQTHWDVDDSAVVVLRADEASLRAVLGLEP